MNNENDLNSTSKKLRHRPTFCALVYDNLRTCVIRDMINELHSTKTVRGISEDALTVKENFKGLFKF